MVTTLHGNGDQYCGIEHESGPAQPALLARMPKQYQRLQGVIGGKTDNTSNICWGNKARAVPQHTGQAAAIVCAQYQTQLARDIIWECENGKGAERRKQR